MGLLKRIVDRRAAKGGKIVAWWRKTFGTGAADELEKEALSAAARLNRGEHPKEVAEDYVKELERKGRLRR